MRAGPRATATVPDVFLLSSPRPEGLATLIVLPEGARIVACFHDDGTTRDITLQAADLITEYVLRGGGGEPGDGERVEVARLSVVDGIVDGAPGGTLPLELVRMALLDTGNVLLEEIPSGRLPVLLAGAIGMAVADAVAAGEMDGSADRTDGDS